MKEVLAYIEKKQQVFSKLEFFEFLQDKSISPKQRLAFAPCFAPFVMGFGELNQYVWRDESSDDPLQAIINQHTHEDDGHWVWFLEDLDKLGFNKSLSFTDALKFIWSKELKISRQTFYEIYRCTSKATPINRLVAIEAVEAIADIFLSCTKKVSEDLKLTSNLEYKYFGMHHYSIDTNHSMDSSETVDLICNINLDVDAEKEALEIVDQMFEIFTNFVNVLVNNARKYKLDNSFNNQSNKLTRITKLEHYSLPKAS
ncbi:MAG: hypothetical protein AAFV71_12665 [Cyanobacteria bacterium J06633_8]